MAIIDVTASLDAKLGDIDASAMVKSFAKIKERLTKIHSDIAGDAILLGFDSKRVDKVTKRITGLSQQIDSTIMSAIRAEEDLLKAQKDNLGDRIVAERKAALALENDKLSALQARFEFEKKATDALMERRRSAIQDAERLAGRTMGEKAEEFGKSITDAFENMKSSTGIADLFKNLGSRASVRGAGMENKVAERTGPMAKVTGMLGKLLSGLGPVLLGIGGLVAGIAAIGGAALGADSAMKDLNKTLFDSGMSAGDMTGKFGMLGDTVDRVRKTFTSGDGAFSFNRLWGTTARDHLEILAAYGEAGYTFREMTAGVQSASDEMERLRHASESAMVYAKLLGTTNVDMAETFASRMEEMGQDIDGVRESFAGVHLAAKESGFGVKRFFNMVLQATSGMTMYNLRLEEAGGLLKHLGDVLGATMGSEFLGRLTKGFGDDSTQDKLKRVMTTGEGVTKKVYTRSARNTAADFLKKLDAKEMGEAFAAAVGRAGLTVDFTNRDQLVKDLGKLSASQQTNLLAEARQSGDPDLVRILTNLLQVTQGAKGGLENMALNLGGLDMGGKLFMQMNQGMAVLKKPLHELTTAAEIMAFESTSGVSGEALEELRRVSQALHGNFNVLRGIQKDQNRYEGQSADEIERSKEDQVKAYGSYVDEQGQIWNAILTEIGAIDLATQVRVGVGPKVEVADYVQSRGDVFSAAAKNAMSADTLLAQEMVTHTKTLGVIMEQGIEYWLERIYGVVQNFMNFFVSGEEKYERAKALDTLAKQIEGQRKKQRDLGKEESKLLANAKTFKGKDREKAEADLARIRLELKAADQAVAVLDKQRRDLSEVNPDNKWFWEGSGRKAGDFLKQVRGTSSGKTQEAAVEVLGSREKFSEIMLKIIQTVQEKHAKSMSTASGMVPRLSGALAPSQLQKMKEAASYYDAGEFDKAERTLKGSVKKFEGAINMAKQNVEAEVALIAHVMGSKPEQTAASILGLDPDADLKSFVGNWFGSGLKIQKEDGTNLLFSKEMGESIQEAFRSPEMQELVDQAKADAARRDQLGLDQPTGKGPVAGAIANATAIKKVLEEQSSHGMRTTLMNALGQAGVDTQGMDFRTMVDTLKGGAVPKVLSDNLERTFRYGDKDVTLKEYLIEKDILAHGPVAHGAHDFLMHIGDGGVKFAQRIDRADQVTAVAHKAGGAVSQSRQGTGAVVINSFGNAAEVIRGIQAAVAAGVL